MMIMTMPKKNSEKRNDISNNIKTALKKKKNDSSRHQKLDQNDLAFYPGEGG